MFQMLSEYPKDTNNWYIYQYLLHGSVERVYQRYRWDIKIPIASYHRLVKRYGIIKFSGRRDVSLSEMLHFFKYKVIEPRLKLETVYNQKMPASFETSVSTLHRTYKNTLKNRHTRIATALVIHPSDNSSLVLVGQEVQTVRCFGKHIGDFSIPMTFAKNFETDKESILRVLQQEVLSDYAIKGKLSVNSKIAKDIIPETVKPIFNFSILDVLVKVYEINLPQYIKNTNAVKLSNLQYVNSSAASALGNFRTGIIDLLNNYQNINSDTYSQANQIVISTLNQALASLSV